MTGSLLVNYYLLPRLNFTSNSSTTSFFWVVQEGGEERLWSIHNILCLLLFPPRALLLQHGIPPMGDSPLLTSPTWVTPANCSSWGTTAAWDLSTGCSPSGTDCCNVGCSWESQLLSEKLLLHGLLSTVCTFPQVTSICSGMGPSAACRISALQAASELFSSTWKSPPSPSSLTLVSEALFLSHSVLFHSCWAAVFTLLYICYHRAATSVADRPSFSQWLNF